MKSRQTNPFRSVALISTGLALSMCFSHAADQTWIDSNTSNDWNTTEPNWDAGAGWTQTNNAIFGGTGEAVTLTEAISAGGLTFNATDYTITGNTLTLIGSTPTLTTGTGIAATISSDVAGIFGPTKAGDGTLTFSNAKTYSGNTNVTGGKLVVSGTLRNSSAFNVAGSGSTLEFGATNTFVANHGTALEASRVITVNGGTMLMTSAVENRIGNVTLTNGGTFTSNRPLTSWDVLLADVSTGAATVAVTGTGMATMNGSGGIHLVGVQNFDVADTTGDSGTDLMVSMSLGAQGSQGGAAGGINKLGVGTMTVKGSGTIYSGATNVTDGTLVLTNTAAWGSAITLGAANSPKLQLDAPLSDDAWNFTKTVSGSNTGASVTKSGSGTVTITTAQTYLGSTNVNAGTLSLASQQYAGPAASVSSPAARTDGPYIIGNTFDLSNSVTVTELGVYAAGATSGTLGNAADVGIWDSSGTLLASVTVPAGTPVSSDSYAYVTISPVVVPAGTGYSMGAQAGGTTRNAFFDNNLTPAFVPVSTIGMTLTGAVFSTSSATLTRPTSAGGGTTGRWGAANMKLTYTGVAGLAAASPVTVANAATFGGSGTAGGVTIASGGAVEGGNNGSGMLTVDSLTFSSAGTLRATLATGTTPVMVTGAVTTSGGANSVSVAPANLPANGTYHVLQFGSYAGSLANFKLAEPSRAMTLQQNGNFIDVAVTANPAVYPVWTGVGSGEWSTNPGLGNWKLSTDNSATDFTAFDNVLFNDTATGTRNIVVGQTNINASVITFNNSSKDYTLSQANGKDIAAGSLVKTGTGKLTVSGSFTFSGDSSLGGGIVSIDSPTALGTGGRTINGGTLEYTGATGTLPGSTTLGSSGGTIKVTDSTAVLTQAGSLPPGSSGSFIKDGPGTLVVPLTTGTYANPIQIADGTLNLNYGTSAAVCSGNITGSASGILRLDGAGADANNGLTLTGNNTFTGETHIYGKRVFLNNPTGNAIGGDIVAKQGEYPAHGISLLSDEQIANTSLLRFEGLSVRYDFRLNGHTETLAGIVCDNGFGRIGNAGNDGGADTGAAAGTLIVSGPGDYSYNGNLLDQSAGTNGVLNFTKSGTGTQTLTGTSAQNGIIYTGATTVNAGTLKLLDTTAFASDVTLNGGTLELSRSSGAWSFGKVIAAGSGAGNVKVTGFGSVTLAGANTYTGATTVESGTLSVTGSIASSPLVDVLADGTLSGFTAGSGQTVRGTGMLSSATFGNGSTLTPGTATAIDTILGSGTITFLAGSTCAMQVDRTGGVITNDQLANMSAITYGGTLTVTATGQAFVNGNVIPLFPNATTYGGSFSSVNLPTLAAGLSWDLSSLTVDGSIKVVNYTATPVFNPPAGGYVGAQSVSISSDTGATIYYTMDGSPPTIASPHAVSPVANLAVPTNSSVTIKAFAKKSGQADSPVATAIYNTLDTPTWIIDGFGAWSDTANWQSGVVAQGSGITADFSTLTLTGDGTVSLDSPRMIGNLKFGDVGSSFNWLLDTSSSDTLTLDAGADTPVVTVNNQTATISATLAGSHGMIKNGAGTLVLAGTNSLTGDTAVNAGTLQLGTGSANGTFAAGNYPIASGARLFLNYGTAVQASVGAWGNKITGAGTLELKSAQGANGGANWGPNSATATPFVGGFTGTLQLDNGRIDSSPAGLGGISNIIIGDGAQFLAWSGTYTQPITIAGNGWGESGFPGGLRLAAGHIATWNGSVVLTADAGINVQPDSVFTIAGSISGNFPCDFHTGQPGGDRGTLIIAPTAPVQNSYASTKISGTGGTGAIIAGNPYAFSTGPLEIVSGGTLKLNGFNFSFANLSGTAGTIGNYHASTPAVLTVGSDNTSTSYDGALVNGSTGELGLAKTGTGTLVLSNPGNSYTGATSVDAGSLVVNGSLSGTPAVTVAAAGTLAGTGTVAGTVAATGTLAPAAAAAGTLTTGPATLTGTYACQIDGADCDKLAVTGNLTLTGSTLAVSTLTTPVAGTAYVIATYSGTLTGTFATVTGVPSGYSVSYATANQIKLVETTGSGFGAWADSWTGLTDKTPGGDPDRDGISNLMEYVIGGDPRISSGEFLPKQTIVGPNLVISYKRRDDSESDTTLTGQWSVTLGSWTNVAPALVSENGSSPDDMTITIPLSNAVDGKLFGRIKVTQP